jgi:hypothetical protein
VIASTNRTGNWPVICALNIDIANQNTNYLVNMQTNRGERDLSFNFL